MLSSGRIIRLTPPGTMTLSVVSRVLLVEQCLACLLVLYMAAAVGCGTLVCVDVRHRPRIKMKVYTSPQTVL